jgi:hypothetical protein
MDSSTAIQPSSTLQILMSMNIMGDYVEEVESKSATTVSVFKKYFAKKKLIQEIGEKMIVASSNVQKLAPVDRQFVFNLADSNPKLSKILQKAVPHYRKNDLIKISQAQKIGHILSQAS